MPALSNPESTRGCRIEDPAKRWDPEPHQRTITPDHVLSPEEWDLVLRAALIASIMEEVQRDQGPVGREP
jgi:hypothetical protein